MTFTLQMIEIPAALAGLAGVYLSTKKSLLSWWLNGLMVSLYAILFFQVKLYGDMGLQLFFLLMQFYGYYQWKYGESHAAFDVKRVPIKIWASLSLYGMAIWLILYWFLGTYTDSTQIYFDVSITTMSILAQWMISKKYLENWHVWVIINLVSIYVYWLKDLYFTMLLAILLTAICIKGYIEWRSFIVIKKT